MFRAELMAYFDSRLVLLGFTVIAALILHGYTKARGRCARALPPGPGRLPFIGNALDIPLSRQWETFEKWAREYGTSDTILSSGTNRVKFI